MALTARYPLALWESHSLLSAGTAGTAKPEMIQLLVCTAQQGIVFARSAAHSQFVDLF